MSLDGDRDNLPPNPSTAISRRRRWVRSGLRWLGGLLVFAIVLGLIGRLVGDRNTGLALMLYLPLTIAGGIAILLDLFARGHALAGPRFLLSGLGVAALAVESWELVARPGPEVTGDVAEIRLLHWNVLWGSRGRDTLWANSCRAILEHRPDIIVLSEAPDDTHLDSLREALGGGAYAVVRHQPGSAYLCGLVIASRWPVTFEERITLHNGMGLIARVAAPGGDLRVFAVDGMSRPTNLRAAFLQNIADVCRQRREEGRPIDLIAGDTNTIARSRNFEAVAAEGFRLASRSAGGWRGSFPAFCPVYDIDHVWVDRRFADLGCEMFTTTTSDHRGQLVRFGRPNDRV